jgi:iron-sulfur cluster repair protein YtfE (RIC family)
MSYPEGEAMVAEFEWVHGILRRELESVRDLARQAARGEDVQEQIAEMALTSKVWSLRIHCLHFCQFVEGHHAHEDHAWFPVLRRENPDLEPVIDRLKREHELVARQIADVEHHAARLPDDPEARPALVAALNAVADHLLGHLDYEERSIFPTLRGMRDWRR